jgi:transposase-like protein
MEDTNFNLLNIRHLIDDARCYETVRNLRWHNGVIYCPLCNAIDVKKHGRDGECQKYKCKSCSRYFDDLTYTIFSGHHQPLSVWVICIYFMGLNLSNLQIANELGLNQSDVQAMTKQLREGIIAKKPVVELECEVECDEVYVIAGHKGHPEAVKKGRKPRRNRLKGARGRGTLEKEKPPIFGMIQRGGQVVIKMLENVQQKTITPMIQSIIKLGTTVYTDEYSIYSDLSVRNRLPTQNGMPQPW